MRPRTSPPRLVEAHAASISRLAEAILDIPHLTVEDRAEGKAVIQDLDTIARALGPEAGSPAALRLFALRERDLLARSHAVCMKYNRKAS
jgi:hypothetical protein